MKYQLLESPLRSNSYFLSANDVGGTRYTYTMDIKSILEVIDAVAKNGLSLEYWIHSDKPSICLAESDSIEDLMYQVPYLII